MNCHGGWIVGLGVLGVWGAASIAGRPGELASWVAVSAAAVAATSDQPVRHRPLVFICARCTWAAQSRNGSRCGGAGSQLAAVGRGCRCDGVARSARAATGRQLLANSGVLTMLAYGAARVQRLESLFVVGAAGAPCAAPGSREWPRRMPRMPAGRRAEVCEPLPAPWWPRASRALCSARSLAMHSRLRRLGSRRGGGGAVLRGASPGRLVTVLRLGSVRHLALRPRLRVSMDGRRETVYTDARIAEHDAIVAGTR